MAFHSLLPLQHKVIKHTSTGNGGWEEIGPVKAKGMLFEAVFSGTTVGTHVAVHGILSSGSTSPITLVTLKTSAPSVQTASTVAGKMFRYIRTARSAGVFSATKYATVTVAALPST